LTAELIGYVVSALSVHAGEDKHDASQFEHLLERHVTSPVAVELGGSAPCFMAYHWSGRIRQKQVAATSVATHSSSS